MRRSLLRSMLSGSKVQPSKNKGQKVEVFKNRSKAHELYKNGRFNESLTCYQEALKGLSNLRVDDSPYVAKLYNEIAMVHHTQENFTEALKYYSMSLNLTVNALGEEHPNTANGYNNIAIIYGKQNMCEKALEYHIKALNIKIQMLGEDHLHVANTYNNIAILYEAQKNYDMALDFHQKALTITLHRLGSCHPYVANSYTNLARIFESQQIYGQALQYYHKALEIRKIILLEQKECYHQKQRTGSRLSFPTTNADDEFNNGIYNHPDIANLYYKMAMVHRKQSGEHALDQATLYCNKAVEIYENIMNDTNDNNDTKRRLCSNKHEQKQKDLFSRTQRNLLRMEIRRRN